VKTIRLFIADHNPLFRQGLVSILRLFPEFRVVGDVSNMTQLMIRARLLQPDIIMMENTLPEADTLDVLTWIRQNCPYTKVIMLAESDNIDKILDVIEAGASNYLVKGRLSITDIVDTVKLVNKEESSVSTRFNAS
jgi:two-component system, NarL family, nitrate/nitrite response regulator NarL